MPLTISSQEVDNWKKRIQCDGLKGSTYFCQQAGKVWVSASVDHQAICRSVLGEPTKDLGLNSYIAWNEVNAGDLVEILFRLESGK